MDAHSPPLAAALRILRGADDPDAVRAALSDPHLAHVVATAAHAAPHVRAIAALAWDLPSLLTRDDRADPDVHAAVHAWIGDPEGGAILRTWTKVAPGRWGHAMGDALCAAVRRKTCEPGVAAALMGPCDPSARLLTDPDDVAFAIRCWGIAVADTPAWWAPHLSAEERKRLLGVLRRDPLRLTMCLPWLPPEIVHRWTVADNAIPHALDAFACASPAAYVQHMRLVLRTIQQATPSHLDSLVRLACTVNETPIWDRIRQLLLMAHGEADRVVLAASWNDMPQDIGDVVVTIARRSRVHAAIAVARGCRRDAPKDSTSAAVFFAALDPQVWDALNPAVQHAWRQSLHPRDAWLAVRSLGMRPDVLSRAMLTDHLVRAARLHGIDDSAVRAALFPVALAHVPVAAIADLMTALPAMPDDPRSFFCIAGRRSDVHALPPQSVHAIQTLDDLAAAVVLQRVARAPMPGGTDHSAALATALHRRSWTDVHPLLDLVHSDGEGSAILTPHALAARVAPPDRQAALLQALNRLAGLPPATAIPVFHALGTLDRAPDRTAMAETIAAMLRENGSLFLDIVAGLAPDLATALLPCPDDPSLAHALHALACDDPLSAARLAYVLTRNRCDDIVHALLAVPLVHGNAVFAALADDVRLSILHDVETRLETIAAEGRADAIRAPWRRIATIAPMTAIALTMLASNDPEQRQRGIALLVDSPAMVRSLLPLLRIDLADDLRMHDRVRIAVADLSDTPSTSPGRPKMPRRRPGRRA